MSRLDTIQSLLDQDPSNSRLRYMLAMETLNTGDLAAAAAVFQAIVAADPDYSAAYFHGGQTFEKLGLVDDARQIYQQGLEATLRNGDAHTRSEIQGALDMLG